MNTVQTLIDGLAERVGQPVGIDDRRFRSLAYSAHAEEIDPVRRTSILGRQAPEQVTDWLEQLGVGRAAGHVRVPGNPELSMVPRVCVPLRFHDRLLGYLWLTEDHGPMGAELVAEAERSAAEIAEELFRLDQEERTDHQREAEEVRRLTDDRVVGDDDERAPWPTSLASAACYAVALVSAGSTGGAVGPDADVRLSAAVARVRRASAPRQLLTRVEGGRALVVLGGASVEELSRTAGLLLTSAETELADLDQTGPVVGVGGARHHTAELAGSRHEAELAVRIARAATTHGSLAVWETLEAYRLVAELADGRSPRALVPPVLLTLLADPDAETLVRTVEAYLEHGGDAAAAASELFVHRSSLYNRLHRVEELAGIDMRSGADRLELHLGLRLWRLGSHATDVEGPVADARQPPSPEG